MKKNIHYIIQMLTQRKLVWLQLSNQVDFKEKNITRNKEKHLIVVFSSRM